MTDEAPPHLRVDIAAIFRANHQRSALAPTLRLRKLPDRPIIKPVFGPPPPPSPPVKIPRRSTQEVKAEKAQKDYERLANEQPWLVAHTWRTPTITEVPDLDTLEALAAKRNARLKRNCRDRERYKASIPATERRRRARLKANQAAGKTGTQGWRSRELRRKAAQANALRT